MKNAQLEPLMPFLLGLDVKAPPESIRCRFVVEDLGGHFVGSSICSFVRNRV